MAERTTPPHTSSSPLSLLLRLAGRPLIFLHKNLDVHQLFPLSHLLPSLSTPTQVLPCLHSHFCLFELSLACRDLFGQFSQSREMRRVEMDKATERLD